MVTENLISVIGNLFVIKHQHNIIFNICGMQEDPKLVNNLEYNTIAVDWYLLFKHL